MKKIVFFLFLAAQMSFGNDMVWSKTGHRAVGEVAQEHLTRKARKAITAILDGESLAAVSNFADEIKADSKYREFSAWHYVNFPEDKKYSDVEPSENGDLIIGIEKCVAIVKDEQSSKEDRAFYLKMLVHLIGDLHQPMHVGRLEDKGGNDIQVQWFNDGSNLHRVWDSGMINAYGMSYTELAASLPRLNKTQKKAIQAGTVLDWVEESQDIANELYDSVAVGEKLSYRYNYVWWDTLEKQLQKGGLRLAKVLNELF
ncbi:S1/P1 nuclease [Aggregatimonas sangjinii]|uniref:S1/P1 nuclease n=1 Tax=Aggregatimonas sangjinii TaxID=2583587 RepID=A0A5B7SLD2_9FLAO|nr:S1/P1 nuclease [Aggregatimonas sangjinii]QCW99256.1 S1/P1 nuclease [Aggregatimonas sangjinii]